MMKKETFISAIEAIEKQCQHDKECAETLSKVFSESYASELMYNNKYLLDALVDVLKDSMNDTSNWIEYYLYELDFGKENWRLKVNDKDGKEIPLRTPEDLYNLLMEDSNA